LADGRVALVGGRGADGRPRADVLLYDPSSGALSLATSLPRGRYGLSAETITTGPDQGRLLIVGGWEDDGMGGVQLSSEALLVDATGGQPPVSVPLSFPTRAFAVTTTLGNAAGEVLVSGGTDLAGSRDDAAVYEPASRSFLTPGGTGLLRARMLIPRVGHTATRMGDGSVLIFGGSSSDAAPEVFVPEGGVAGAFISVAAHGATPLSRQGHVAALLDGASVLIVGGQSAGTAVLQVQRFDPHPRSADVVAGNAPYDGDVLTATQPLPMGRVRASFTALSDDTALLVGGASGSPLSSVEGAELYVPCLSSARNRCPAP
jgi:hypothetical protein